MPGIPFLSGYRAREEQIRRQEQGDLQNMGTLQGMLEKMRARQQDGQMRSEIAALGPNPSQESLAGIAARFSPAADILKSQTSSLDRKAALESANVNRADNREQRLAELTQRGEQEIARVREAAAQNRITREDADRREAAMRENITRLAASLRPAPGAADKPKGDFSKSGAEFIDSLPEVDRQLVKKIASYDVDPKTLSTRGGHREKMLSLVTQYDPSYDDTQYANKRRAIAQFGSGPQGNTVRSLNVAIEHIDTLKRAADALKNGEFTPGNKAYNEVAKVFGVTPPNTFEGIRDIVSNEVIKGTIGNAGALEDRKQAAEKIRAAASPQQLNELMNSWTELMGGQVKGLERQYESSTRNKDFRERYLTQRTRDAIALAESKVAPAVPAAPGGFDADKERRYQEWKKKNGG